MEWKKRITQEAENMTIQKQVYRCNVCGNIVEVVHAGKRELVCCGAAKSDFEKEE